MPDRQPTPPERGARPWWALPLAALFAAVGAWVAPGPWSDGSAQLIIRRDGHVVRQETVAVRAEARFEMAFPMPAGPVPDVRLVRAGGTEEIVPVVSQGDGRYLARRQPPVRAPVVLGLLGAVIVLWISEFFPLFVTSLAIPVVLAVAGVGSAGEVLAPFFDPIIVLFFAGFILAEAMRRVALDRWAAVSIVAKAGTTPRRLYFALLATSALLSMWMSNTAAVAVLIPIALTISAPFAGTGFRKAAVLGIAYAATIGGVGSAIGTPANQIAMRFTNSISFAEWFLFGLPMVVLLLPIMGAYLWRVSNVRVDPGQFERAHREAIAQRAALPDFTAKQWHVLAVFALIMVLWLTQGVHGVHTGIVALGGAVVLFALRRVEPKDLARINWSTLLTFGGGLTLGLAMVDSGVSDWVVTRLGRLEGVPPIAGVFVVAVAALALTTVASNTASAATLVPLAIPLAAMLHVDPVLLAVTVAIATSIDFALVVGTPPTMLAFGTGLFTPGEILRKGLPLDLIGLLLLLAVALWVWSPLWRLVGG